MSAITALQVPEIQAQALLLDPDDPHAREPIRLLRFVQVIDFSAMATVGSSFDIRFCAGLAAMPHRSASLFPALREVSIYAPSHEIGAAFTDCPGLAVMVLAFRHVANIKVGWLIVVRPRMVCWTHMSVINVDGLRLEAVCSLLSLRPSWCIDALCIDAPLASSGTVMDQLLAIIGQRCPMVQHLHIMVEVFDNGMAWSLMPTTLRTLFCLGHMTCLALHAPLSARLSDADWEAAAWAWPHMDQMAVVDTWGQLGVQVPCTLDALLYIVTHCPRITTLRLPAVDCRTIPSLHQTAEALSRSPLSLGYPLEVLDVGDGVLLSAQEVGRFLHSLFPRLGAVTHVGFQPFATVPMSVLADWVDIRIYIESFYDDDSIDY
ncbi:hypothetical protein EV715DRAFT_297457 [Schizophyllum commune]